MVSITASSVRIVTAHSFRAKSGARKGNPMFRISTHRHSRAVQLRATEDDKEGEEMEDTQEARVSGAMKEFADAGFPSEEGDAQDPVSRTKAMNGAVEDLNTLMDSELEVLGKAYDILEKIGLKPLKKPPARDAAEPEA